MTDVIFHDMFCMAYILCVFGKSTELRISDVILYIISYQNLQFRLLL